MTVFRTATATAWSRHLSHRPSRKGDAMGESGGVAPLAWDAGCRTWLRPLRQKVPSEMVDAGSALTLGAGSGALPDAPSASGAFVTEWTVERATGAVVPGSGARAAASAVAAPASAKTTPTTVIGMASLPNLMASPRNTWGLPQDPSHHGKRLGRPSHGGRTAALSTASRRPETPASAGDGEVCYIMFTAPQ